MGFIRGYRQEKKRQRLGELGQQYLGGDEGAFRQIAVEDPVRAGEFQKIMQFQAQKQQQDLQKASMLAQTVLEAEPEERADVYRATLGLAKNYGIDTEGLPDVWTEETGEYLQNVINMAKGQRGDQRMFGKTPEGYVVDPEKEEIRKLKGFKGTPESQEKMFARTTGLRKEYVKESDQFIKTRDAFNKIEASFEDPSPAGDMAGIFSYMKLLDPGSTVREGEYATVEKAGSVPNWVRRAYNKAVKGDLLTPKMRKDFSNRSKKLFNKQKITQKKRETQYRGIAKRQGLPEQDVLIDLYRAEGQDQPKPQITREQAMEELRRRGKL